METEAPYFTWRRTSGAAPDAVKAARPVLNGGREETCRKVTRLAPTQRRGAGDQTWHVCIKHTTSRPLRKGPMLKSPPIGRYVHKCTMRVVDREAVPCRAMEAPKVPLPSRGPMYTERALYRSRRLYKQPEERLRVV